MRLYARALVSVLTVFLMLLSAAQCASAKVERVRAERVDPTSATFDVRSVRASDIRTATVRMGGRRALVRTSEIKRAARRGRLRVPLPRPWRRTIAARRSALSRRRGPRVELVFETRSTRRSPQPGGASPGPVRAPSPGPAPAAAPGPPSAQPHVPAPSPVRPPDPAPPVSIGGRTFYVSPAGSDANAGTSPTSAWRTVARANRAALSPGDGVLFRGGATFTDDTLMPGASGEARSPIVYGSYGGGKARLARGVWFMSKRWLAFTELDFTGANQGILGSANGSGSTDIRIQHSNFENLSVAVNAANPGDRDWVVDGNTVDGTRDSGFILQGDGHLAQGNTILNTGTDLSISYGKHGIYLKSSHSRVIANTIRSFQAEGVSSRYRNAVIESNTISRGQIGIAWYQGDSRAGTSSWRNNVISETTAACLYVSPSDAAGTTGESFVVSGNSLSRSAGRYTDFQRTIGTYSVFGNAMQ